MWQFKVLYYCYTMRMEARATWHCAMSTWGDGQEIYSNLYVILICTCTEHYQHHLPQRVRVHCTYGTICTVFQSLTVIRTISLDVFSRKIFVPCCRAFYLCVLVRPFALASIFRVIFFSSLPFFYFLMKRRYHSGIIWRYICCSKWGNIARTKLSQWWNA